MKMRGGEGEEGEEGEEQQRREKGSKLISFLFLLLPLLFQHCMVESPVITLFVTQMI